MRLFRTVRHDPPEPSDFLSGEAEGRRQPRPDKVRFWRGFSTFDTLERARAAAIEFNQGGFIAELEITEDSGIT